MTQVQNLWMLVFENFNRNFNQRFSDIWKCLNLEPTFLLKNKGQANIGINCVNTFTYLVLNKKFFCDEILQFGEFSFKKWGKKSWFLKNFLAIFKIKIMKLATPRLILDGFHFLWELANFGFCMMLWKHDPIFFLKIGLVKTDQGIKILNFSRFTQFSNKAILTYTIAIDFHI